MELKIIGITIGVGETSEYFDVGVQEVVGIDKLPTQTGELLVIINYKDGSKNMFITSPACVVARVEEVKITTAGIENFLPK